MALWLVPILAGIVVAWIVAGIVIPWLILRKPWNEAQQFWASLAKDLPPEVQASMKPNWLGFVIAMVIAAVVGLVAAFAETEEARAMVWDGFGLVMAVWCAAWTAWMARKWLERRHPGELLVDLSPYPIAGAVRRMSRIGWVSAVLAALFVAYGRRLFQAGFVAIALAGLLADLMYSDRVWLAERGLYLGGWLHPWKGFERVAWTGDGRAFALRRKGQWLITRWIVVPVPAGSREAVEAALRQTMPALTPAL